MRVSFMEPQPNFYRMIEAVDFRFHKKSKAKIYEFYAELADGRAMIFAGAGIDQNQLNAINHAVKECKDIVLPIEFRLTDIRSIEEVKKDKDEIYQEYKSYRESF